jgi:hypothetical protein
VQALPLQFGHGESRHIGIVLVLHGRVLHTKTLSCCSFVF